MTGHVVRPAGRDDGPRLLRRAWLHVTRQRARAGLYLTVVCIVAYAATPSVLTDLRVLALVGQEPDGTLATTLQQFFLVLASVAAGAVFLPEISSDLWRLTGSQVRRLVPLDRRRALARALVEAEVDDDRWTDLVMDRAFVPLVEAGATLAPIVHDMGYTIEVHLAERLDLPSGGSVVVHAVGTTMQVDRYLPPQPAGGGFSLSVARTQGALSQLFREPGCLARELVPIADLQGEDWFDAVCASCRVAVVINGQVQQVVAPVFDPGEPDIVRWTFLPDLTGVVGHVPVRISFDFPIAVTQTRFPVIFASYYCAGATVVSMKLFGDGTEQLEVETFFARALGEYRDKSVMTASRGMLHQEVAFTTGRDSLLWPGSGVVFLWSGGRARGRETDRGDVPATGAVPAPGGPRSDGLEPVVAAPDAVAGGG